MDDFSPEERERFKATIAWLEANGPDDWHRAALDFNWGEPLYLLDWIVRQEDCDIATALEIFWLGEPECWLQEDGTNDEKPNGFSYLNRKICEYVSRRVKAGGYKRSEIAFDPDPCGRNRYVQLAEAVKNFANPNIIVFPGLIARRGGRKVENDKTFYRRYPEEFHYSAWIDLPNDTPRAIAARNLIDGLDAKVRRMLPKWLRY